MKRFIWTFAIIALITSCKSQQFSVHDAGCTVIRDSVSVTYKQGRVELDKEPDYNTSRDSPSCVTAPLQHTSGQSPLCNRPAITVKPQHDGLTSQAQRCSSARPLQIPQKVRVDTLIVERWHTEIVESQKKKVESAKPDKPIPRFYKRCTWGFFILLLLIIGRIAFRILKAIYLKR